MEANCKINGTTNNCGSSCAEEISKRLPYTPDTTPTAAFTQDVIRKFYESVTSGDSSVQDLDFQFEPFKSMDETLLQAPLSVQTLAFLALIGAKMKTDIRLDDYGRPMNFTYLKKPDSFRASMSQIGHEGWKAFRNAHKAMDVISARTSQFHGHAQDIVNMIFVPNSDDIIEHLLPISLNETLEIIHDCTKSVESVVEGFERTTEVSMIQSVKSNERLFSHSL